MGAVSLLEHMVMRMHIVTAVIVCVAMLADSGRSMSAQGQATRAERGAGNLEVLEFVPTSS